MNSLVLEINMNSCFDKNYMWDFKNNICSDDCIRKGGVFEVEKLHCKVSEPLENKETRTTLFTSVQKSCSEFQNILSEEFGLKETSVLDHANALQYDYPWKVPISYTYKYNFGQDGVCNFVSENNEHIQIFIRKNAIVKSEYSANEFDMLKIEKKKVGTETPSIIWERD